MKSYHLLITSLFVFSASISGSFAALGDKESSIEADRKTFVASRHAPVAHAKYTVQEIASDGLTVREYVNADGTIYAIAWNGINHPDLSSLMGSYFQEYQAASKRAVKVRGRRPAS